MKRSFLWTAFWLALITTPFVITKTAAAPANTWQAPGTNEVVMIDFDWLDAKRNREVPVRIYYPKVGQGLPLILFSHGLGGSREGYEYLGRYWAAHGYVSVHVQHLGTDTSVWEGLPMAEIMPAMRRAVANPQNAVNRPLDISYALDQVEKLNRKNALLEGRLNLKAVGIAGHSFGAFTTLAIAGEIFVTPLGEQRSRPDPRFQAAIAMSESVPAHTNEYDLAFSKIKIPMLHMTGTIDDSPIGETKANQRRIPFDHIHAPDQYLINFTGGDHMIFSGRLRGMGNGDKDPIFHDLICATSTAFWDAYLKHDPQALKSLTDGETKNLLGTNAVFEKK